MHSIDITNETKKVYRLTEPGTFVYFAKNRSGKIDFVIEHSEVKVYAFFIFDGKDEESFSLTTAQRHTAPSAESHILVKSVLKDASRFDYSGNIIIEKMAQKSNASLENRNLLVGKKASAETKPFLEILADDVRCRHSATTAPLNPEHLAYLKSRGIPVPDAEQLLVEGFLRDVEEKMRK